MRVLQLGAENWADKYQVPNDIEWHFNDFPERQVVVNAKHNKNYDVVIITDSIDFDKEKWTSLQKKVYPYNVLILPEIKDKLNDAGKYFLKCQVAEDIKEDPQTLIDHLKTRYFFQQFGLRFFPQNIILNQEVVKEYSFQDSAHMQVRIYSPDKWSTIGTYKYKLGLIHDHITKLWLEAQKENIDLRLKLFIRNPATDGDPTEVKTINICDSKNEAEVPVPVSNINKNMTVVLQAKGNGNLVIGVLHSRWSREGRGSIVTGGKRIVDLNRFEDIAYYFNPGDLKPPLNIYFSGANWSEAFQGLGLFRRVGAPALLFTDLRLEAGQYFDSPDHYMMEQIVKVIKETMEELHFDNSQIIVNGSSMGSYAALKIGAKLGAYMINVSKPIGSVGFVAGRTRLQRPDNYEAALDVAKRLTDSNRISLEELNDEFWDEFNSSDLSNTRVFVAYKENDDYDNAINKLKQSPAIQNAAQFSFKGFPGRHIDGNDDIEWFTSRIKQVLKDDFGRKL